LCARQHLLVLDGPLHGFAHPFRLSALVCLRQRIRNVATLLYLTVPSANQLSNVLIFFSQSGHLLSPASPLRALPMRFSRPGEQQNAPASFPTASRTEMGEAPI
jgi:hypothetical protein